MMTIRRKIISHCYYSANFGGAVYVADETNAGVCASSSHTTLSSSTECFLQTLQIQLEVHTYILA